ncbi:MAG: metal-dependent hydrolase [Nanoarchaeota archaeon]|nr:metal-dependent hydrolase [Nanoarchaeota archaeon]
MPNGVAHILIPILILSLIFGKKFKSHYYLLAGLAGALPDVDIILFYILSFYNYTMDQVHHTFSHSIFFMLIFVVFGVLTIKLKPAKFMKREFKPSTVLFIIAFGVLTHILLDFIFYSGFKIFYPYAFESGLNLLYLFPKTWRESILPLLDGIIFIIFLVYLEFKKK